MKLRFKTLLASSLFFSLFAYSLRAQDTGTEPHEEVPEFMPYMINHPFEGCPGGSQCTKATGLIRKDWSNLLKNKAQRLKLLENFRQKHGLPLALWSYPVKPLSLGLSLWNSPCPGHNLEGKKIFLGEMMAPDFKSLKLQKNLIVRQALMRAGSNEYIQFPIPRAESPLYISQNHMIYNLDIDGDYYGMSVAQDGTVHVVEPKKPQRFPENIVCPPEMLKAFQALPTPDQFYQGASCKSIWDIEAKTFRTIIVGWSCG